MEAANIRGKSSSDTQVNNPGFIKGILTAISQLQYHVCDFPNNPIHHLGRINNSAFASILASKLPCCIPTALYIDNPTYSHLKGITDTYLRKEHSVGNH
jgi:hypothetical protein